MHLRSFALTAIATVMIGSFAPSANAGPLIDWLFRGRQTQPTVPVGAPIPLGNGYGSMPGYAAGYPGYVAAYPGYSAAYPAYPGYANGSYSAGYAPSATYIPNYGYGANLGNYYGNRLPVVGPNGAGYTAQMPSGIAAATLPQPMSYVPNYASNALKAPVTYYRPLLTTDPNTGAQVVAMAPCTSYQYLTQRVPTLGQSALYGSYQAPQYQPLQATPTYTLPSGGIPLAQSAPTAGAVLGYSPYSSYQVTQPAIVSPGYSANYPPINSYPTGTYPANNYPATQYSPSYPTGSAVAPTYSTPATSYSTPLGSSSFVPSTSSTGTPYQPVPGLMAPPASSSIYSGSGSTGSGSIVPGSPATGSTVPGSTVPGTGSTSSGGVYPSGSLGDPANTPPSLPMDGNSVLRPQLKSIVPEATRSGKESALNSSSGERSLLNDSSREFPINNPIPAPEGMEKPSWSPGLLRTEDMTALRPVTRSNQLAGQSKKIHWASFEQELTLSDSNGTAGANATVSQPSRPKAIDQSVPALRTRSDSSSAPPVRNEANQSRLELAQPSPLRAESTVKVGSGTDVMVPLSSQGGTVRALDSRPRASFNPNSSAAQPATSPGTNNTSGWTATRQ